MKNGFRPLGAILNISMSLLEICILLINLITFGYVGQLWYIAIAFKFLGNKHFVIWNNEGED